MMCSSLCCAPLFLLVGAVFGYEVPEVKIEVLKPKGFTASIPDAPGIGLFSFNANINSAISSPDIGDVSGEVLQASQGRWTFRSRDAVVQKGDTVNYWVMVSKDRLGYLKDNLKFQYNDEQSPSNPAVTSSPTNYSCLPSVTTVRGLPVCSGQVIFQDDFEQLTDKWLIQQYIPKNHPDYPFVSYQNLPSVINVTGGQLHISPVLLQTLPPYNEEAIRSGTLDLYKGCTESGELCHMAASGADILPPVVSGRASTKQSFSFKYGVVLVRAKLALGDWFYPEILLEPTLNRYGVGDYSSGVIMIGSALGNPNLRIGSTQIGITRLVGGAVVDRFECHDRLMFSRHGKPWSDEYHDYEVRWAPDGMTWSVDGEEFGRLTAPVGGLQETLRDCRGMRNVFQRWSHSGATAPFDQEFHLTLGLAAGGVTMFIDGSTGGAGRKPWNNLSSKSKLNYWQHLQNCPQCHLVAQMLYIDAVKVTAL